MKPYLSLIIPSYNNPEAVVRLLASLAKSKATPPYEVIVVDDGSSIKLQIPNVKLITLLKNHGPAVARNRGAARARGKFLVFLDADVEVFPDTIVEIAKVFRQDPDVVALTGVWVKEQKSKAFFPNFKALRDWSYWINEDRKSHV
jgi:glycosyltransferase involved in cell wall biosynthesis